MTYLYIFPDSAITRDNKRSYRNYQNICIEEVLIVSHFNSNVLIQRYCYLTHDYYYPCNCTNQSLKAKQQDFQYLTSCLKSQKKCPEGAITCSSGVGEIDLQKSLLRVSPNCMILIKASDVTPSHCCSRPMHTVRCESKKMLLSSKVGINKKENHNFFPITTKLGQND